MILKFAFIIFGVSGIVLFFPYNFGNTHTCLAHKYLGPETSSYCENTQVSNGSEHCNDIDLTSRENHYLASHYLYPFGFLWWASIGLVVLQVRNIRLKRKRLDKRNKGQIK